MALKGDLTELSLTDLVEMTSLGGKTGRLIVYDEHDALLGELDFRGGRLVGARCGELEAEKAFYALLVVKAGSFKFDPAAPTADETCDLGTESLLIEAMRRFDEIMRLRRRLPAPARVRLLGGEAGDAVEARVLGYLGPGTRRVGDIVEGVLVGGESDEYDALHALQRLTERDVVRVEGPVDSVGDESISPGGPPQPELER